jgi:hypothetical protein
VVSDGTYPFLSSSAPPIFSPSHASGQALLEYFPEQEGVLLETLLLQVRWQGGSHREGNARRPHTMPLPPSLPPSLPPGLR